MLSPRALAVVLILLVGSGRADAQEETRTLGPTPAGADAPAPVRAWLLCGLPGGEDRIAHYTTTVSRTVKALRDLYRVEADGISVAFGDGTVPPYRICDAATVRAALAGAGAANRAGSLAIVVLMGHANTAGDEVFLNLRGPDIPGSELGGLIGDCQPDPPLLLIASTAASGRLAPHLAGPGRVVIAAAGPTEPDNETEFPHALVDVLENPDNDLNGDGVLSLLELYRQVVARVRELYDQDGLILTEHAAIDGNGDGVLTQRPDAADALPLMRLGLPLRPDRTPPIDHNDAETGNEQP